MREPTFSNLRAFLDRLRRDGDLAVVDAPVSARLEVAEIHRRVIAAGGPALLFTKVDGSDHPVVTNLFGTSRRAELAFGKRPKRLIERAAHLAQTILPPTLGKLWDARDLGREALKVGFRPRTSGPVTESVSGDVRLSRLPILTTWPGDGGPFVTLPLVLTRHPETGGSNLGMYRLQVHDERRTGMHWQIGKGGGFHYAVAESRGESLPVTVFLGGPPALILSAIAPLPENVPELILASLIAGERLTTCSGPGAHPLIAESELALIGSVPPRVRAPEGPFGDHYGYYSLRHDYPVFEISHVAKRRDAIYPATVVGKPRQEDVYIGDLLQELLAPLFPLVMPAVTSLWSYGETGYHSLAAAVVKQRYRREAMASAFRILGEGQLSLTKFLIVLDREADLRDFKGVLTRLLERTRPETDLFVFANVSMDTLDYTGPAVNEGSKGVWLGVGEPVRELPREFRPAVEPPAEARAPRVFSPGCLVVGGPARGAAPDLPTRIAQHPAFAGWPLIVLTDEPERAAASPINFLWTTFTRFEPAADIHAASKRIVRNHIAFTPPVVIDARLAPGFPDELFADEATSKLVDRRWKEYFGAGVEMGDSSRGHL
ncbi:MAG TPA: UbiD family decarboxylase, partial [Candidatus Polarisedimenticolaceae bacterium]|nr:UbiD family decarboxylase [Candidatus Polarisedimenticolaceae bacterium]